MGRPERIEEIEKSQVEAEPIPLPPEFDSNSASAEDVEALRRRFLLWRFWMSARGFWGRSGTRIAWLLPSALFLIIVLNLSVQYGINV